MDILDSSNKAGLDHGTAGRRYNQPGGRVFRESACGNCYDIKRYPTYPGARPGGCCNPLIIQFTEASKRADWNTGRTWTLQLYPRTTGWLAFTIKRTLTPVTAGMGPNRVFNPQIAPGPTRPAPASTKRPTQTSNPCACTARSGRPVGQPASLPGEPLDRSPLYPLLQKSCLLLNASKPDLTVSCWLCYDAQPPF